MTMQTLTMPRLGETMEEGVIVGWLVQPGTPFRRGDPILELETDKTVVEFPALGDGVLNDVLAGPGDRVAVGAPIAHATVANPSDWNDSATDAAADTPAAEQTAVLTLPRLGETMEEGVVVQWLVAEGAAYVRGDALLEIETDKTVAEVPALSDGRLIRILAEPGARVSVGQPIAEIEGDGDAVAPSVDPSPSAAPVPVTVVAQRSVNDGRLRATPVARKLARQKGIALQDVQGSGRRGRIEDTDVLRADGAQSMSPPGVTVAGSGGRMHLLIHGFAGDQSAWAATASALRRAGHRTAVFDLPGHGDNGADAPDLGALVTAALAVAQSLPGPLVLVGHSLGAVVAAEVAARLGDRVSGLVLLTPAGCGPEIGAEFVHGMANAATEGEVAHLLRLLGPNGGALSPPILAAMTARAAKGRLRDLANCIASPDGRQRIDLIRALDTLPPALPIRAVFGRQDQVVRVTDAMNLPARVAVHFLPAGHMPQWDAPTDVVALILKGHRDD